MHDRATAAQTEARERPLVVQIALEVGLAAAFAAAPIVAAKVRLPLWFTPVPLTLQTLVVLLAGGFLGPRVGAVSQLGYLLMSLLGLPVLALPSFIGPTGGYVIGFVFAAIIMGYCARRQAVGWLIGGAVAASLTILACGSLWLSAYTGRDLRQAFLLGLAPFLAGDALKAATAVMILRLSQRAFTGRAQIL